MNAGVLKNTHVHVPRNINICSKNIQRSYSFYIYFYSRIFTRFLCASEYRNNFERKVIDRKRSRTAHLRDINHKSYKCYTQAHREMKIVPTDEDIIHKVIIKRKLYLQGHPGNGKSNTTREHFLSSFKYIKNSQEFKSKAKISHVCTQKQGI